MSDSTTYQVLLEIVADESNADELDATAEVVLDGVLREASFVAFGPVVSVDHALEVIEIECTLSAESADDVHKKMARILDVMLESANSFEYQGSTAKKLEPALA